MPHITLECTNSVIEKDILSQIVPQIHQILTEKLPTELINCKTRVTVHENYAVGNGDENNAFVHLSICVLKGRKIELLDQIASIIMEKLKDFFHLSLAQLNLQISIGIQNLPDVYMKLK